jgi:quinolinate synthase
MLRFARESDAREFIVATEIGLLYPLRKENPDKRFYPATTAASCANMKRTTLEKVLWCLEDMRNEVRVDEEVRRRALAALNAMVAARK